MSWHQFWPLLLFKSRGRYCSLGGLPDCGSHLPKPVLGNFLWGLAVSCHRTAWITYLDLQVKFASVVTQHSYVSKCAFLLHSQNFLQVTLVSNNCSHSCLCLFCRGCVIGPTFNFNVLDLDFGDVIFGELFICYLFLFIMTSPHIILCFNPSMKVFQKHCHFPYSTPLLCLWPLHFVSWVTGLALPVLSMKNSYLTCPGAFGKKVQLEAFMRGLWNSPLVPPQAL